MLKGLREFLRKIGPNRTRHMLSIMPKDADGFCRWIMDGSRDIWTFPHAPCTWLCKRNFRRFHFTCLTCWTRRKHFRKRGHQNLKWYSHAYMANKPPIGYRGAVPLQKLDVISNTPVALPIYYTNYGIFISRRKDRPWDYFRLYIVKYLLTLAERIAEL